MDRMVVTSAAVSGAAVGSPRLPPRARSVPQNARGDSRSGVRWAHRLLSVNCTRIRTSRTGVGRAEALSVSAIYASEAPEPAMPGTLRIPDLGAARSAFAPATIANLGPGFDFVGAALEGQGNVVTATFVDDINDENDGVTLKTDQLDQGGVCKAMDRVAIQSAAATLAALRLPTGTGVELRIRKGIPLKSGLGGTAATAVASVWAVNLLFGEVLSREQCVVIASECALSGYSDYARSGRPRLVHDARVISAARAPASLLGGFVLLRGFAPVTAVPLPFGPEVQGKELRRLWFCLVTPDFKEPAATAHDSLPASVPLQVHVENCSAGASMIAAVQAGDLRALGAAIGSDQIAEVVRGPLIPGFYDVRKAALDAGAFGCTLSGSGPTLVAIPPTKEMGMDVCKAMVKAFQHKGVRVISAHVVALCPTGVREFYEEMDMQHSRLVAFQVARELARRHRVVPPIVTGG